MLQDLSLHAKENFVNTARRVNFLVPQGVGGEIGVLGLVLKLFQQGGVDMRRDHGADIPAQRGDFPHRRRREEGVLLAGNQGHSLDSRRQFGIGERQPELELEIK